MDTIMMVTRSGLSFLEAVAWEEGEAEEGEEVVVVVVGEDLRQGGLKTEFWCLVSCSKCAAYFMSCVR